MDTTTSSKRWSNIDERMCKLWNSIFHDKTKDFDDKWSISCETQLPEPEEWNAPLVEFLKITFKCKECAHVWPVRKGLAHLFFRYNKQGVLHPKANGEVLIWLQDQHCPSCSSTEIPAMDVKPQEMDAVLSYLKLEIGWIYYNIPSTAKEKNQIEDLRRMTRKMKMLMRMKKKEILDSVESTKQDAKTNSDGSNKVLSNKTGTNVPGQGPRSTSAASGSAGIRNGSARSTQKQKPASGSPGNRNVPARSTQPKPANGSPVKAVSSPIKKKTRWDKTPEQIRSEWELAFEEKFAKFVTKKQPHDRWTFELDKVTKKHPLRAQKLWHWFLGERVEAGFHCSECGYVWESRKGWVAFWIRQNDYPAGGKLQGGHVTIHVLGQKCEKCLGRADCYQVGDLQGDEIERVLSFLFMEIDYWFYGNKNYTEEDEQMLEMERRRPWKPLGKTFLHKKSFCQACSNKVCSKSFKAQCKKPKEITDPVLEESKRRIPIQTESA